MQRKIELINSGYDVSAFAFPKNFNHFVQKMKQNGYDQIVKMTDTSKIIVGSVPDQSNEVNISIN